MRKRFFRISAVLLAVLMVVTSVPYAGVMTTQAADDTQAMYLYEQVTSMPTYTSSQDISSVGDQYAIVVAYGGRYYAIQMVDPEVYGMKKNSTSNLYDVPSTGQAPYIDNVNTANTRDVTNLIMEKNGKKYLVGCDDTILWTASYYNNGITATSVDNTKIKNANQGFVFRSNFHNNVNGVTNRVFYPGKVQDKLNSDNTYIIGDGDPNLYVLKEGQTNADRGLNYNYYPETGEGELFAYGKYNYNYFVGFMLGNVKDDKGKDVLDENGAPVKRLQFKILNAKYTVTSLKDKTGDEERSANILLFHVKTSDTNAPTIQVKKTVSQATELTEKYINYSWNENGMVGAYQVVYQNSAKGLDTGSTHIYIPTNELKGAESYVIASGNNTLKSDLSTFLFDAVQQEATNTADATDKIDICLDDNFFGDENNEGGSVWKCDASNSSQKKIYLDNNANEYNRTYLYVKDYALGVGSTANSYWKTDADGKLMCQDGYNSLYFDGNGWVTLETKSNVGLYQVVTAGTVDHPANCVDGHYIIYQFDYNNKHYESKVYIDRALNPTNHGKVTLNANYKGTPTCSREGYEGATICELCGTAVATEKPIAIDPNAHNMKLISHNGTHCMECQNTDIYGVQCTNKGETENCTNNGSCVCSVCGGDIPHQAEPATCIKDSVCKVCGKTIERAKGHTRSQTMVSYNDGTHGYQCTVCQTKITVYACKDISEKDCICDVCQYDFGHIPGASATCQSPQRCINCNKVLNQQENHDFSGAVYCDYNGHHAKKCVKGCNQYGYNGVANQMQDCYDSNNDCKCDICGYQMEHTPGAAATCTTEQRCTVCNTVIVEAKGHDFTGATRQNNNGTHSYQCKNETTESYGAVIEGVQVENGEVDCAKGAGCVCECGRFMEHNPDPSDGKQTCTAPVMCKDCHQQIKAQLEHNYSDTNNVKYNNDGTHSYGCINGCNGYGVGSVKNDSESCYDSPDDNDCLCDKCKRVMEHTPGTEPTCITPGYCKVCNEPYLPALGHQYDTEHPVYNNDGTHSGYCSRCKIGKDTPVACYDYNSDCKCDGCERQYEHDYNVPAATCMTAKYCNNCGEGDEAAPKLEHDFTGKERSNGDGTHSFLCTRKCEQYGYNGVVDAGEPCYRKDGECVCGVCGYTMSHLPGVKATCEAAQKCTNCKAIIKEATGHSYTGKVEYNNDGTHSYLCENGCNTYGNTTACVLNTKDCTCVTCEHQFDHTKGDEATCVSPQTCTICHTTITPKLAHDYTGKARRNDNGTHSYLCKNGCGTYSNTANCVKDVKKGCKCETCDYQFAHNVVVDPAVKEDCLNDGLTEGTHCADCKTTLIAQEIIPATNHPRKYEEKGTPASCFDSGIEDGVYCPDCEKWIEGHNVIPQLEHQVVIDKGVKATCISEGITEGSHCSVCKTVLVEQEVLPASGHDYVETVIKPTCKVGGYTLYECSYCHDTYIGNRTSAGDHEDSDNDGYCDVCNAETSPHEHGFDTGNCDCMCHDSNSFTRFIYKIAKVFWKLFKTKQTCKCGVAHY